MGTEEKETIGLTPIQTLQMVNHQSNALEICHKIIKSEITRNPEFLALYRKDILDLRTYVNEIIKINSAANAVEPTKRR